jgi:hypothetical protein
MRLCAATLALLLAGSLAAPGIAAGAGDKPKLAALILKTGDVDEELADNLTEVLIARIAGRGDHEIAGKEELKSKLGVDDRSAAACLQDLGCLGRAGTELGVTRLVVGTLGRRGNDYLYNLNLIDIVTGKVESRVFQMVAGGKVDAVIAAVQVTADKLFQPKVEPGAVRVTSETRGAMVYLDDAFVGATPVRRDGIDPGAHGLRIEKEGHLGWAKEIEVPAGSMLEIKVSLDSMPERRKWPGPWAASCAVVAGLAAVVGIVMEALANSSSGAATRKAALDDAQLRHQESLLGIGFLSAAAGLAATAATLTIYYRRDIFGGTRDERPKPARKAALAPAGLGVAVHW